MAPMVWSGLVCSFISIFLMCLNILPKLHVHVEVVVQLLPVMIYLGECSPDVSFCAGKELSQNTVFLMRWINTIQRIYQKGSIWYMLQVQSFTILILISLILLQRVCKHCPRITKETLPYVGGPGSHALMKNSLRLSFHDSIITIIGGSRSVGAVKGVGVEVDLRPNQSSLASSYLCEMYSAISFIVVGVVNRSWLLLGNPVLYTKTL